MEDFEEVNELTGKALNAAQKAFFDVINENDDSCYWSVDFTAFILDMDFIKWRSINYQSSVDGSDKDD